jgi:hypothetical protein
MSASYLDLHLEIGSEGRLRAKLYDKRDDFNFRIVNIPLYVAALNEERTVKCYISVVICDTDIS